MTVAQVCFVLLDLISSASVPSSVADPPIYSWYIYHCPCHLLADLHAGLTVVSCHALVPTRLCAVISLRCHSKAPRTNTRVYPPTYLPNYPSIYSSTHYLLIRREDLIPIHLSIYYFLLFLFWKTGGKDTYELDKAYSINGNGATAAAMLCYLHGRTLLFIPAFSVVFIYRGELTSTPPQSTHFRTLIERGKQFSLG